MAQKILVTGGAGYIGSHTVAALTKQGFDVTVFDSLISGHRQAVSCPLIVGDLLVKKDIDQALAGQKFAAVIHFAAFCAAGESMTNPAKYFENNLQGGVNLLEAMRKHDVNQIVFSSTCATYGSPQKLPVSESEPQKPVSVYGESKLMFEKILNWYDQLFGIKSIKLRYFNAAGASLDGSLGEDKKPFTTVVPILIQVALGQTQEFTLFGDDYKTPDGTCVRDYVHVLDLASAHIKALAYLAKTHQSNAFNVGTGHGCSNKEMIDMVKKISGVNFTVKMGPRRPGDPDAVYADNRKIKDTLGWQPEHSDLETIVKTAWHWHRSHPQGFATLRNT